MKVRVLSEKVKKALDFLKENKTINDNVANELTKDFETNDYKEFYAVLSFTLQHSEIEIV